MGDISKGEANTFTPAKTIYKKYKREECLFAVNKEQPYTALTGHATHTQDARHTVIKALWIRTPVQNPDSESRPGSKNEKIAIKKENTHKKGKSEVYCFEEMDALSGGLEGDFARSF